MIKINITEDNDSLSNYRAIVDFAYWNNQSIEIVNEITKGPKWVNIWTTSSGAGLALEIETEAGMTTYNREEATNELERIFG